MLDIENLHFRYGRHAPPVLQGVNLQLADGEIGILLGKNGSGKTTLFRTILGLERPQQGTICFGGDDLAALPPRQRARKIAYVPQHIHFGSLTVYDSILMGRMSHFGLRPGPEDHRAVEQILAEMQLEPFACRNAEQLSGGEKQKVAIARALVQQPELLVFDEPTGNLDLENGELIVEEARRASRERHITILSSLHDLNQALHLGDRFFFLKDGVIRCSGGTDVFTPQIIEDIFHIPARIVEIDGQKIILGGKQYVL